MIIVDEQKCGSCGFCCTVCPREALKAWGVLHIDHDRCTDCFGGLHQLPENKPLSNKKAFIGSKTLWRRACIENCPVSALSAE